MPLCDCGALTSRYVVHTQTPDGHPLKDSYTTCPTCRPKEFAADKPFAPLDRLVTGPEAMPNKYKLGADGVYRPTDELMQDTDDLFNDGPTSRAEKVKRATRRTEPLTETELAQSLDWGKRVLGPAIRERKLDEALRNGSSLPEGLY